MFILVLLLVLFGVISLCKHVVKNPGQSAETAAKLRELFRK